ncbi:hypothetical protein C9E85_15625 [Plesiomonas shigelloides]|uniref:hypothetical protein n=1 Tax=Plesiomonas shigelloides TaxID=703 RepID=UPI000D5877BA|nr:hypothetical protein [Plesiomonas shigelloides]PVU64928.1 hypothetical protein C9E85_15625 [Plesiomonas shigelloides]
MIKTLLLEFLYSSAFGICVTFICFILSSRGFGEFDDAMVFPTIFGGIFIMLAKRFIITFIYDINKENKA